MASKRRNMFYKNKKQGTTEIVNGAHRSGIGGRQGRGNGGNTDLTKYFAQPPVPPHTVLRPRISFPRTQTKSCLQPTADKVPQALSRINGRAPSSTCGSLKELLGGKRFSKDGEVKETVEKWLCGVERSVFDGSIKKLAPRLKKCIEVEGSIEEEFLVAAMFLLTLIRLFAIVACGIPNIQTRFLCVKLNNARALVESLGAIFSVEKMRVNRITTASSAIRPKSLKRVWKEQQAGDNGKRNVYRDILFGYTPKSLTYPTGFEECLKCPIINCYRIGWLTVGNVAI
ncbi:hypothetical protein AAG570_010181 [Ranatra chinensis]|uniref:Uncharacterized protein n=1 Tax=Ranatra chinensis TaxID=642074 RepID=A0ABD0ZA53_9HEMI